MSVTRMACIALLCALVAHSSQAAPILTVTPGGLNAGNREWSVNITPDVSIFGPSSVMAAELAFSIDDPVDLLSVVVGNAAIWDTENPGNNPFTGTVTDGIYINLINDHTFVAYGSAIVTSSAPTHFLTITTAGAGLTTLRYGTAASGHAVFGARIAEGNAQTGLNFDGYTGIVSIPEPAAATLAVLAAMAVVSLHGRQRRT